MSKDQTTDKPTPHPAKFSAPILARIEELLHEYLVEGNALDPFAGTGLVHTLANDDMQTWGLELEPEWAIQHPRTFCGDVLVDCGIFEMLFDCIITSPCYGNRMADSHVQGAADLSTRHTYTHYLKRKLTAGNAGAMQWGRGYRKFHRDAWGKVLGVLRDDGVFVLNVSDHVRKGKVVKVAAWHKGVLASMGVVWVHDELIETRRQGHGENGKVRVDGEHVMVGVYHRGPADVVLYGRLNLNDTKLPGVIVHG